MPHTVPLEPTEREVLRLVAAAQSVAFDTLAARLETKIDAGQLERLIASFQRGGLVDVAQTRSCSVVSITREGELLAARVGEEVRRVRS